MIHCAKKLRAQDLFKTSWEPGTITQRSCSAYPMSRSTISTASLAKTEVWQLIEAISSITSHTEASAPQNGSFTERATWCLAFQALEHAAPTCASGFHLCGICPADAPRLGGRSRRARSRLSARLRTSCGRASSIVLFVAQSSVDGSVQTARRKIGLDAGIGSSHTHNFFCLLPR